MKVILATGIFYPDIGGPAIHVRKISEALVRNNHQPVVLAYGDYDGPEDFGFKVIRVSRRLPKILRILKYFSLLLVNARGADAIYAFNVSTAGIPAFIVGKILRKKILIRVPGDPIWERIVESGKRRISFVNYYERGLYKIDRPWLFRMIKFILPKFDKIIFYSPFLSEIYTKYYLVPVDKTFIILNPVSRRNSLPLTQASEPTILFAGRFVAYKNLDLVIRVFDRLWQKTNSGRLILIGDGPDKKKLAETIRVLPSSASIEMISRVNQEKLFEYIYSSWLGIGPALTEFNPNFILECLSFGKPVLISRENGLSVKLPEDFLFDPLNEKELEEKLTNFFDENLYLQILKIIKKIDLNQTWDIVTSAHLGLLYD